MSARLNVTILEMTDGLRRREKPEPHPEIDPPRRLVPRFRGQEFRPHGTDAVGVIVSSPRNRRSVQFYYRHAPDVLHSMLAHEFNERFAVLLDNRKPQRRAAAAPVVRPLPPAFLHTLNRKQAA